MNGDIPVLYEIPYEEIKGRYFATTDGHIVNKDSCPVKPFINSRGYLRVRLHIGNNNIINIFRNKHDAANVLGLMPNNIKRAIINGSKCGGYRWRKVGGQNE